MSYLARIQTLLSSLLRQNASEEKQPKIDDFLLFNLCKWANCSKEGLQKTDSFWIFSLVLFKGGGFSSAQAFYGRMSRLNVWSFETSASVIKQMSRGCGLWSGDAVAWYNLKTNIFGNIEIKTSSSCSLAGKINILSSLIRLEANYKYGSRKYPYPHHGRLFSLHPPPLCNFPFRTGVNDSPSVISNIFKQEFSTPSNKANGFVL